METEGLSETQMEQVVDCISTYDFKLAVENNKVDLVQMYLPLFESRKEKDWALGYAAEHRFLELAEILLQDKEITSLGIERALKLSAVYGCVEIIDLLLKDPRCDPTNYGYRCIALAAGLGRLLVVERFLEDERIDPSEGGNFSLLWAVNCSLNFHSMKIAKLLIKHPKIRAKLDIKKLLGIIQEKERNRLKAAGEPIPEDKFLKNNVIDFLLESATEHYKEVVEKGDQKMIEYYQEFDHPGFMITV